MPSKESPEYRDLYNSGFFKTATLQKQLFDQLRQVGVVDMITDVTKRKFFRPASPQTKEELEGPLVVKEWPTEKRVWEEAFDRSGWRVSVLRPEMSTSGKWSEMLKIEVIRAHREFYGGMLHPVTTDQVLFSYSPHQNLFIDGSRRFFNGKLVIPPIDSQTEKLKTAVNQAFGQPKTEQVRLRRRIMGPIIRLRDTV